MAKEFLRPAGWTPKLGPRPTAENAKVSNKSGGDISAGALVIKDLANMTTEGVAVRVKTTTTVADRKAYGVAFSPLTDEKMGYVTRYGPVEAATSDAAGDIAVGDELVASDYAAGFLEKAAPGCPASAVIAYAMEAQTSDSVLATASTHTLVFIDPTAAAAKLTIDATAAGKGFSPLIWDDCPVEQIIADPSVGFYYFNDYLGPIDVTTADGYVITAVTSGNIEAVVDEQGGVLQVSSGGNAGADDGVNVQLQNCMFKSAASVKVFFEARCKMTDTGDDQYFIGLAGVDTTLIAAGIMDDVVSKCGFFRIAASTADKISSITARTNEDDATANVATIADGTYVKLGFVIDGLTSVKFYVNGVLVETGVTAAAIANDVMCLSYVAQVEQTSADADLEIDWVRIAQVGGRI